LLGTRILSHHIGTPNSLLAIPSLAHKTGAIKLQDSALQQPLLLQCRIDNPGSAEDTRGADEPQEIEAAQRGIRVLPGYELEWDSKPRGKRFV